MRMQAWCRSSWPRKTELLEMFLQKVPFLLSMLLRRNAWPTQGTCSLQLIHLHHEIVAVGFCEHQADRCWNKRRKISCWQASWSWCTIYCHGWNNWIFFPYWWFPAPWSLWCWGFYRKHVPSTGMTKTLKILKCAQKILFLYFINYSYFIFL